MQYYNVMRYLLSMALIFTYATLLFAQSEPSWINSFPYSAEYYTGIGSSNRGNKSQDYERALSQARLNLAAEISTSIKAETEIETRDSTEGGYSQTFTEKLNQSVEQHLKELEIVDTWYSARQGYWVYVRLEKSRWAAIQQEEMSDLLERIQQIINSQYFAGSSTTSDKLNRLGNAATLLDASPYRNILSGTLGDIYSGNIFDFIQSEIYRQSSSISIVLNPEEAQTDLNGSVEMRVDCRSSDYYTGKLPLLLVNSNGSEKEILTDISGMSRLSLKSDFLSMGTNRISVKVNPAKFGFPASDDYLNQFFSDEADAEIRLTSSAVYLNLMANRENLNYIGTSVSSLFSEGSDDFQIVEDRSSASYEIVVTLTFSDFPRVLENAPLMAGLTGHISLKSGNRVLYEYRTDPFKDGGLSYEQAYERVFRKMMRALSQDKSYIAGIEREIKR